MINIHAVTDGKFINYIETLFKTVLEKIK